MDVSHNMINGQLPSQWGDPLSSCCLHNTLQLLDISSNLITGSVPSVWSSLAGTLTCVSMANNSNMCGAVPKGVPCFDAADTNIGARLNIFRIS